MSRGVPVGALVVVLCVVGGVLGSSCYVKCHAGYHCVKEKCVVDPNYCNAAKPCATGRECCATQCIDPSTTHCVECGDGSKGRCAKGIDTCVGGHCFNVSEPIVPCLYTFCFDPDRDFMTCRLGEEYCSPTGCLKMQQAECSCHTFNTTSQQCCMDSLRCPKKAKCGKTEKCNVPKDGVHCNDDADCLEQGRCCDGRCYDPSTSHCPSCGAGYGGTVCGKETDSCCASPSGKQRTCFDSRTQQCCRDVYVDEAVVCAKSEVCGMHYNRTSLRAATCVAR